MTFFKSVKILNQNFKNLPSNINRPQDQGYRCEQKEPKISVIFTSYARF